LSKGQLIDDFPVWKLTLSRWHEVLPNFQLSYVTKVLRHENWISCDSKWMRYDSYKWNQYSTVKWLAAVCA